MTTASYYILYSVACLVFSFVASGAVAVQSVRLNPVLAQFSAILALILLAVFVLAGNRRIREFFLNQLRKRLPEGGEDAGSLSLLSITRSAAEAIGIAICALIATVGILLLVLLTFHISVSPAITLENFVVSEIIALFSPSGGGFGFVELGLTGLFSASGVPANQAALVVFTYRLLTLWLEVLLGYIVLLAFGFKFIKQWRK